MGRKIPVRKHRGVKDPLQQLARRNACSSINAPPSNPKEQELPKSVLEIKRLCELVKNDKKGNKNKKGNNNQYNKTNLIDTETLFDRDPKLPGMTREVKGMPKLFQRVGECDEAFFHRFSSAAHEFLNEVELENKHGVKFNPKNSKGRSGSDVDHTDSSNETQSKNKKRKQSDGDLSEELLNSNTKRRKNSRQPHLDRLSTERGSKPNRKLRQKMRRALLKKLDHEENEVEDELDAVDFTLFKDEVKFGEVAHRPPQFTAKPRGSHLSSKPGTKDLLLKEMINNNKSKEPNRKLNSSKSNAQKHFLELERIRVVQAYRDMKANRTNK